jgi:OmpA-OmpF porin, OOP family
MNLHIKRMARVAVLTAPLVVTAVVFAQPATPAPRAVIGPNQVVAAGTVPDEATRVAIISRLREVYGTDGVSDQLTIGSVVAPPNWSTHLRKLISPELKRVSRGQLSVNGNLVDVKGEVANEAQRQQVVSDMASALNPTYTVKNSLRVAAGEQGLLDRTLANRIVEFQSGSSTLTPQGRAVLDEMAAALLKIAGRKVEVAEAVKNYLATKGVNPATMQTLGVGPDRPVADNTSAEGRARNRRIEFRVSQ